MPLPSDERIVTLADKLIEQFDQIFGLHPGFRPAHAKGVMLAGTFTPSGVAQQLSKAPHFHQPSTPVTVRFSNSTGIPAIPDNAPDANPRGMAIRFHLAEHIHTDIVSHSTDGFPTRDGDDFLSLLKAVAASGADVPSPKPIEQFLGSHPAALAFVQAPKPFPSSFGRETYFGVTAFEFTNAEGQKRFGRYRTTPEDGNDFLSDQQVSELSPTFHFDEIVARVKKAPVGFNLSVQVAAPGDQADDATVPWPADREIVQLGHLELTSIVENMAAEQQKIIFDPIPRVEGIDPSADPLLELRAAVYLISGRRRRQAPATDDISTAAHGD